MKSNLIVTSITETAWSTERPSFLASQDALEVIVWVSQSVTLRTELTVWPWWVKIHNEDFTDVTLAIGDTNGVMKLEVMMGVLDMDFDKVSQPGGQISN